MIKVTRELFRKTRSCCGAADEKEFIPADGLTIREVAELKIPAKDKIFAICYASNAPDKALREFACWCARNALNAERKAGREPDPRFWTAVDVAERYARGEVSEAELEAASYAAYEAYEAAFYAARAAHNAASNAAFYAPINTTSATPAACDAAYYASCDAASNAACNAPSDSARRAIRRRQLKKLVDLLS